MKRRSSMAMAAGILLLMANACGERPLVAPGPRAAGSAASISDYLPGERNGPSNGEGSQSQLVQCERREAAEGSGDFGPNGGELAVGRARLIIPPGALKDVVHITATEPSDDIAYIEFQPEGLTFRKPAGLILDAEGCALRDTAPDVVYLNEAGEIVERIEARYSNYWHTVAAPIEHFSGYALAW